MRVARQLSTGALKCLVAQVILLVVSMPWAEADEPVPLTGADQPAGSLLGGCCCSTVDWTKLPPHRPHPRPGYFLLPPTLPGYYSFHDWVVSNYREKPPAQPWGGFLIYQPSFFDADFRYLEKPDNTQWDVWDPLKRIHPTDDWLLSFGGQAWWRTMNEVDSRLTIQNNDYGQVRTRLYGDLWYRDEFRLFVEGIYADSFWQNLAPLPIDINRADFLNLFVEAKVGTVDDHPIYLRVGRQEMLFGSQRLVSTLDWAMTRRTFQGVRGYRQGEQWDVDLFWVQPVVVDRNRLDSVDNNQNFAGLWATYKPRKGVAFDCYYLMLDNTSPVVTGQQAQPGGFTVNTIGSRAVGDHNNWLWDVEATIQFGSYANQDLRAGSATTSGGYCFADLPAKPQLWICWDYASGESNPGQGTTRSTFNQLFPFGHYYLGYLDLVGRQNIHDLSTQFACFPAPWITAVAQFHHFRLDSPRDALYAANGRTLRVDPTGAAGVDVGNEIDLVVGFHLSTHSNLLIGWSKLFTGRFIEQTGPKVNPELFYLMYGYRW